MSGESVFPGSCNAPLSSDRLEIAKRLIATEMRKLNEIRHQPRITVNDKVCAPATWPQQRLWFIDRLEGHSKPYHIPLFFRLCGQLHLTELQLALNALLLRHEILRTRFMSVNGELYRRYALVDCFRSNELTYDHS